MNKWTFNNSKVVVTKLQDETRSLQSPLECWNDSERCYCQCSVSWFTSKEARLKIGKVFTTGFSPFKPKGNWPTAVITTDNNAPEAFAYLIDFSFLLRFSTEFRVYGRHKRSILIVSKEKRATFCAKSFAKDRQLESQCRVQTVQFFLLTNISPAMLNSVICHVHVN